MKLTKKEKMLIVESVINNKEVSQLIRDISISSNESDKQAEHIEALYKLKNKLIKNGWDEE